MLTRSTLAAGLAGAALMLGGGAALAQTGGLAEAIDNPARAADNVEIDMNRKPDLLLEFLNLQPGDVVLDYIAGGGYWSELFSGVVGVDGKVYAHNTQVDYGDWENLEPLTVGRGESLPLEDESVDVVFASYVYHHMFYNADAGDETPPTLLTQLADFHRVLKPGGRLVVVEHQAKDGMSRAEAAGIHRTAPSHIRADMSAAHFDFMDEAPDIYSNPEDPEDNYWRDAGLSGNTTSLVHVYVKP